MGGPDGYEAAGIPGTINLPRGLLESGVLALAPGQDERLYAYCTTGTPAALATKSLHGLGVANAATIDTGVVAPVKAGQTLQISITDEKNEILPAPR
jgi:rhodanese-related sulfurtransferase